MFSNKASRNLKIVADQQKTETLNFHDHKIIKGKFLIYSFSMMN